MFASNRSQIPTGIWILGFVSLLMDVSSEMIHSLLPLFLVGTLGVSVLGSAGRQYVLPIVSRSVPGTGNRNKLTIALALVRSLAPVMMNQPVRLLFNAWFMRARLVLPLLSRKMPVIGQARCDTAYSCHPTVCPSLDADDPKPTG